MNCTNLQMLLYVATAAGGRGYWHNLCNMCTWNCLQWDPAWQDTVFLDNTEVGIKTYSYIATQCAHACISIKYTRTVDIPAAGMLMLAEELERDNPCQEQRTVL